MKKLDDFNDIDNFNDGQLDNSFEKKPEEKKKELTKEEIVKIRQQLLLLLFLIIFIMFGMLMFVFSSPKPSKVATTDKESSDKKDNNIEEDTDKSAQIEKNDLDNDLYKVVDFDYSTYLSTNILPLYKGENIDNLSSDIKLILLSRSKAMRDLLNEKKATSCSRLTISKEEIDEVAAKMFKVPLDNYPNYYQVYFSDTGEILGDYSMIYKDGNYTGDCVTNNPIFKYSIDTKKEDITTTDDVVKITQKVVFINKNGAYKDPDFKQLITNDKAATQDDYFPSSNSYVFEFKKENGNYYLMDVKQVDK